MAIQNASDLLVYRRYPSAVAQVTRIKIKATSPLDGSGTIKVLNTADGSGNNVAELTTGSCANTGADVLAKIKTLLQANGYDGDVTNTDDGDFKYRDFTNDHAGDLTNNLSLGNGSADIDAGASIVSVITDGEDSGSDPVAHSTSANLTITRELRDITTKDSSGSQENAEGLLSFEISTDALQDFAADLDFQDFFNDIGSTTAVTVRFAQRDTGGGTDKYYEGSAFITSLSMDAGVEENATYSATFTGTATLSEGTD